MNGICYLQIHGIQIKSEIYRSSITQFVADNLGIHEVFHLKCCFRGKTSIIYVMPAQRKIRLFIVLNYFSSTQEKNITMM
jgi:hypothetical protein